MAIRSANSPATPSMIRAAFNARRSPLSGNDGCELSALFPTPVHLYAEADVSAGGEVTLRAEALANRTGMPIEVHELRFHAEIAPITGLTRADVGSFLRVKIDVNGKPITNGFLPIWLLGKTEQSTSQVGVGTEPFGAYVWRFARTMYLPTKAAINVQLQHGGTIPASIHAGVGVAGKYATGGAPVNVAIPYATGYVSKPFSYDLAGTDESSETDMANTTGRQVSVERLVGRVSVAKNTAGTAITSVADMEDIGISQLITARLLTSKNVPIIRDFTTLPAIFGSTRAIDVPHAIGASDFYRVSVKKAAGPTLQTPPIAWSAQVHVAAIGWREEAI